MTGHGPNPVEEPVPAARVSIIFSVSHVIRRQKNRLPPLFFIQGETFFEAAEMATIVKKWRGLLQTGRKPLYW